VQLHESAERAFNRRVVNNLLDEGEPGAVMAYDRAERKLFMWTAEVVDPKAAAKWFG
jgi:hypothetical protein